MDILMLLSTVTECDVVFNSISAKAERQKYKKLRLEHRLEVHSRAVSKATEALSNLEQELAVFHVRLSVTGDGSQADKYRYKIAKMQLRMLQLERRLDYYNPVALLTKEMQLEVVTAELEAAVQFLAAVEARRAELLKGNGDAADPKD